MKTDTLKKIKKLAETGSPGEKEAAQELLAAMCEKYKITPEMLDETIRHTESISFTYTWEFILMGRLAQMITDDWNMKHEIVKDPVENSPTRRIFKASFTEAESAEFLALLPAYYNELLSQMDEFTQAFCINSNLYPPTDFPAENTTEFRNLRIYVLK